MGRLTVLLTLGLTGVVFSCSAGEIKSAWKRMRDLPEARIFEVATAFKGRVYAVTSGEDGKPGSEVHEYDPASDTWTRKNHANRIRHSFGAGVLDAKIYIWGGASNRSRALSTEVYDIATDQWKELADFPRWRIFAKGVSAQGRLFAVGGILPPGRNPVTLVDEYDPGINRWIPRADMPFPRDASRVASANGRVYVLGTLNGPPAVLEYDPIADRWTQKAPMPTPRFDFGIHASKGLIYTFGGMGSGGNVLEVYEPAKDRWIQKQRMPLNNWEQVAAEVNNRIYVIGGGFPAGSVLPILYQYDPAADK